MMQEHYNNNHDRLVKKIARRVGSEYNAEDVVQEAYTRSLTYWNTYKQGQDLDKWFNTILNNATRDFQRDERLQGRHVDVTDDNLGDLALVWPPNYELLEAIQGDIEALPHPDCDIMHLYFNKEYTPKEIGHIVPDVSAVALRKKIQRFKEAMRSKYE